MASDLISRQAVLMSLADYQLQESPNWGANGMGNTDAYEAITECIRVIEQAPTIDPVKHGKWIVKEKVYPDLPNDSDYRYECSLCGWEDQHNEKMIVPYCWHCGALMDKGEPDDH